MIIEANDVTVTIDHRDVVRPATLSCQPGGMTALIGPSGSGKTTLLHTLGLLQAPTSGCITLDGQDTTGWNSSRRRRFWQRHAAFVLQDHGVIEDESVGFNVTMSASPISGRVRGDKQRMIHALEQVALEDLASEPAAHLSGGEKQRLSIARAIYKSADIIFVDEPTASLDSANRSHVIRLFQDRARSGCTVIVSTHDEEMIQACDSTYSLTTGGPNQVAHSGEIVHNTSIVPIASAQ
jgi:putative ABC transport system ATP-binding protein